MKKIASYTCRGSITGNGNAGVALPTERIALFDGSFQSAYKVKSFKLLTFDAESYGIAVSQMKDIVRLKTYMTDADDLVRARTMIVNHDIVGQITLRARLVQGPIPIGLREDRYCITFWELI